jgi:hypothetical protein
MARLSSGKPSKNREIGSFRSSLPWSSSCRIATWVKSMGVEPMAKIVSGVLGICRSRSAKP